MLQILNMSKHFASQSSTHKAVDGISLQIQPGEFFSLLGPSGCGKTTLLRSIAGFEAPTAGDIQWNGQRINEMPPQDRPFNMVFQRYALFPHMTVADNVAFGLRMKRAEEPQVQRRVKEVLDLVGMADFAVRRPDTLSGGQAQRVALARAIVNAPKILLLDEPLSALDQKMREYMQTELKSLQKKLGITFLLVTHDQEEALALSDRIAVMNHGKIEQIASPRDLYDQPASYFVAQFIGRMGSLKGKSSSAELMKLNNGQIIRGQSPKEHPLSTGVASEAFVRPDRVRFGKNPAANEVNAKVVDLAFRGMHYEVQLSVNGDDRLSLWLSNSPDVPQLQVGADITVHFLPSDTHLFERPNA